MRRHLPHRLSRTAAAGLVVCGIVVPNAGASGGDLRSPDARDAAVAAVATTHTVDLVSPDARDSGRTPSVDLRSPDARDSGRRQARVPVAVLTADTPPQRVVVASSGFDWGDFGIGIAAALGLGLLAFGAVSLTHRGRTGGSGPSPLAS